MREDHGLRGMMTERCEAEPTEEGEHGNIVHEYRVGEIAILLCRFHAIILRKMLNSVWPPEVR